MQSHARLKCPPPLLVWIRKLRSLSKVYSLLSIDMTKTVGKLACLVPMLQRFQDPGVPAGLCLKSFGALGSTPPTATPKSRLRMLLVHKFSSVKTRDLHGNPSQPEQSNAEYSREERNGTSVLTNQTTKNHWQPQCDGLSHPGRHDRRIHTTNSPLMLRLRPSQREAMEAFLTRKARRAFVWTLHLSRH